MSVVTVYPDTSVEEEEVLMSQHQVRRLPVVENGNLVGMLALGDLAVQQQSDQKAGAALSEIFEKDHFIKQGKRPFSNGRFIMALIAVYH